MRTNLFLSMLIFGSLFFFSCSEKKNNDANENLKDNKIISDSSMEIVYSEEIIDFLEMEGVNFELPLKIDSLFLNGAGESASGIELKTKDVKILAKNILEHEINQNAQWGLDCFYLVDSLKINKLYEKYLATIDIGMVKYGDAYFLGKLEINRNTMLLIWMTNFSSYEACPFFAGLQIFGTLVYNGNISNSTLLAEQMAAGDAPVGMHRLVYCSIESSGTGTYYNYQEETDEDENYELVEKVSEKEFDLIIENGNLKISGN
ncbi:MAG: hypothetical protein JXR58_13935 [Bacteroidales bacterium]|nr:hypothetical protein [Bacteroidales bacterium]